MQQQFLEFFSFNTWEVLALCVLLFLVGIQLYFYFTYYRKPYRKAISEENIQKSNPNNWKVSVIISSENEVMRLSKNLPLILQQNYPDFEVIVINNGSTDETDDLIESLKLKYTNLYCTYVPYSNDKDFGRRKLAFTLGAKAAKGDVLLFTEPHSSPVSNNWIRLMVSDIDDEIEVVLGSSYFTHQDSFANRIARFDNHLFNMQFLSKALKGNPFTGVYRNVAYKKSLFFNNKGFASHLALENGEDVFINQIVSNKNTRVCLNPDSFTAANIDNNSLWKRIKKNYSVARTNFKDKTAYVFSFEIISRLLFYILFIGITSYAIIASNWGVLTLSVLSFVIRLVAQLIIINKGTQYFKSGKYHFSIIVVDLLQPVYNLVFRTRTKRIKGLR